MIHKIYMKHYMLIHTYNLSSFKKKGKCIDCKKVGKTEWSLQKNKKHTKGIENYRERCPSCHKKYDRLDNQVKYFFIQSDNIKDLKSELIWDMLLKGYKQSEVARIFNINAKTISRIISSEPLYLPAKRRKKV